MLSVVFRPYRRIVNALTLPLFLRSFLHSETGKEYSVGLFKKIWLVHQFKRNTRKIRSLTHYREHVMMAEAILRTLKSKPGVVIECGSYKGASTASLSLVCSLTNRRLLVCDSFQGLPEPGKDDQFHDIIHTRERHTYAKGWLTASIEEVKKNVSRYGCLNVCEFIPGYFQKTLPTINREAVMIFLDVDLAESLRICLEYLWPLLGEGCKLFTHEAQHFEISSLFFDKEWWMEKLHTSIPGLVGAGIGISYDTAFQSSIGYAVKCRESLAYKLNPQMK